MLLESLQKYVNDKKIIEIKHKKSQDKNNYYEKHENYEDDEENNTQNQCN
jgi:hypothetical protein